jgi:hypothetical protein
MKDLINHRIIHRLPGTHELKLATLTHVTPGGHVVLNQDGAALVVKASDLQVIEDLGTNGKAKAAPAPASVEPANTAPTQPPAE